MIVLAYLVAVICTARWTRGYLYGVLASILAPVLFNYFFTRPYFTFVVYDPSYWMTFAIMLICSLMVSRLIFEIQNQERIAQISARKNQALYDLSRSLSSAMTRQEIIQAALHSIQSNFSCTARFEPVDQPLPDESRGQTAEIRLPLQGREGLLGWMCVPSFLAEKLDCAGRSLMDSILDSTSIALERQAALKARVESLEEARREHDRGNMLRSISHDFRTPLASMMGTSEMIMDTSDPQDPRYGWSRAIHQDALWLHGLMENILSLTRLEDGRLHIDMQSESAEEMTGSAVEAFERIHPDCPVHVTLDDPMMMIDCDARLIEQVLGNLLENAARHAGCGRPIDIHIFRRNHEAVFEIRDAGPGIAESDLPHIFEKFYTTGASAPDGKRGAGLGLAICQSIVQAHHGTITAANRSDGPGAEFIFTLPLAKD